jgi:1,4-alpha-glucan branching enzyme
MLFMGEEWGATQPFPFFCDFGPDLADAVRNGRREEFARFTEFRDPALRERIPDPLAYETFAAAKLAWEDLSRDPHAGWLNWYRRILAVRRQQLVPRLHRIRRGARYEVIGEEAVVVRWALAPSDDQLVLAANLSAAPRAGFPPACGSILWREGDCGGGETLGPFAVRWSIEKPSQDQPANQRGLLKPDG